MPALLHLLLKFQDVLCHLPEAFRRGISQAILILIPVAGNPAFQAAFAQEKVPVPELRDQFKVPGCYEFALEFLEHVHFLSARDSLFWEIIHIA